MKKRKCIELTKPNRERVTVDAVDIVIISLPPTKTIQLRNGTIDGVGKERRCNVGYRSGDHFEYGFATASALAASGILRKRVYLLGV